MWQTLVVNQSKRCVAANEVEIEPGEEYSFKYLATGIHVIVEDRGAVHLVEADGAYKRYVGSKEWAVKVISGPFTGYWGYDASPTMGLVINEDGTFTVFSTAAPDDHQGLRRVPVLDDVRHTGVRMEGGSLEAASRPAYDFGAYDFTIQALIQSTGGGTIASRQESDIRVGRWRVDVTPEGRISIRVHQDGDFREATTVEPAILSDEWVHVAAVRKLKTLSLFVNGREVEVKRNSNGFSEPVLNSRAPLVIGNTSVASSGSPFRGVLASVMLWSRALSAEEILRATRRPPSSDEPGLVAHFPLNGDLADRSPVRNALVAKDGADWTPVCDCHWIEHKDHYVYCAMGGCAMDTGQLFTRRQRVTVAVGTQFLFGALVGSHNHPSVFPEGVVVTVTDPKGRVFDKDVSKGSDGRLFVRTSGRSLWALVMKDPEPGTWQITTTAKLGTSFHFVLQTAQKDFAAATTNAMRLVYGRSPPAGDEGVGEAAYDCRFPLLAVRGIASLVFASEKVDLSVSTDLLLVDLVIGVLWITGLTVAFLLAALYWIQTQGTLDAIWSFVAEGSYDPRSKVTVCIWPSGVFFIPAGHASLLLPDGTYISWWPINEKSNPQMPMLVQEMQRLAGSFNAPAVRDRTFEADKAAEHDTSPMRVDLVGLDVAKIKGWWEAFRNDPQSRYKLLEQNCSTTVFQALMAGGAGSILTSREQQRYLAVKKVWTPGWIHEFAHTLAAHTKDELLHEIGAASPCRIVAWRRIGHAVGVVAMAALGDKLFNATSDNRLWVRDAVEKDVPWQDVGHAKDVVAMAGVGSRLFAATKQNRLWVCDAGKNDFSWREVGHVHNAVAMTALGDKLFAATKDNRLWVRDAVEKDVFWRDIGHAFGTVAMAACGGKLFAATSDGRLWVRDPVESNINWQVIGRADDVVGMAGVSDKLFAATKDNRLWRRPAGAKAADEPGVLNATYSSETSA